MQVCELGMHIPVTVSEVLVCRKAIESNQSHHRGVCFRIRLINFSSVLLRQALHTRHISLSRFSLKVYTPSLPRNLCEKSAFFLKSCFASMFLLPFHFVRLLYSCRPIPLSDLPHFSQLQYHPISLVITFLTPPACKCKPKNHHTSHSATPLVCCYRILANPKVQQVSPREYHLQSKALVFKSWLRSRIFFSIVSVWYYWTLFHDTCTYQDFLL